ncbi:MAG TPA: hypothetical protein EYP10_09240 [Armatimonadetes bacterium]|nr:hypothetical protein [Armatimonadota bacterium]
MMFGTFLMSKQGHVLMNVELRTQFVKVRNRFYEIKRQTAIGDIAPEELGQQNGRNSKTMTTILVIL